MEIDEKSTRHGNAVTCEASVGHRIGRRNMAARCLIPLSVLSGAFVFLLLTMNGFVNPFDDGIILVGSNRILSSDVRYRDFYLTYIPGQIYVLAALFKVLGPLVLVERLWDLLVRSCVVLVICLIVDGAWSRLRALFAGVLTSIRLSYFENYGYSVFPCLFLSSLVSIARSRYTREAAQPRRCWPAGSASVSPSCFAMMSASQPRSALRSRLAYFI
jgi:hypothetical protein